MNNFEYKKFKIQTLLNELEEIKKLGEHPILEKIIKEKLDNLSYKFNIEKQKDSSISYDSIKEEYMRRNKRICIFCLKSFAGFKNAYFCSSKCKSKARKYSSNTETRECVFEKFGTICQECFKNFSINELEIHHIVPLYLGGNDVFENLTILCLKCHKMIHRILEF